MKYLRSYLYIILFFSISLTGCIKEDLSGCPPAVTRLSFSYSTPCAPEPTYPTDIDSLHLYVFDAYGLFVADYIQSGIRLDAGYSYELPLKEGTYQVVTWAGTGSAYQIAPATFIPGKTTFDEAVLSLRKEKNESTGTTDSVLVCHESLYFGLNTVTAGSNHTVNLTKNTTGIHVSVSGLPMKDTYRLVITGDDNYYDFVNNCASSGRLNYIQSLSPNSGENLSADADILNPGSGDHPIISIADITGKELYRDDLVKLITDRMPDVNFDCTHEFDIEITFKTDLSVSVSVNGWNLNEDDFDL